MFISTDAAATPLTLRVDTNLNVASYQHYQEPYKRLDEPYVPLALQFGSWFNAADADNNDPDPPSPFDEDYEIADLSPVDGVLSLPESTTLDYAVHAIENVWQHQDDQTVSTIDDGAATVTEDVNHVEGLALTGLVDEPEAEPQEIQIVAPIPRRMTSAIPKLLDRLVEEAEEDAVAKYGYTWEQLEEYMSDSDVSDESESEAANTEEGDEMDHQPLSFISEDDLSQPAAGTLAVQWSSRRALELQDKMRERRLSRVHPVSSIRYRPSHWNRQHSRSSSSETNPVAPYVQMMPVPVSDNFNAYHITPQYYQPLYVPYQVPSYQYYPPPPHQQMQPFAW